MPHTIDDHWLRGLPAPTRVNYFYGLLLTEELLRRDQRHAGDALRQMNRLTVGQGVLTGLDFTVSNDDVITEFGANAQRWRAHLNPGVALDGYGRSIVVPGGPKDGTSDGAGVQELAVVEGRHATRLDDDLDGLGFLAALTGVAVGNPAGIKAALAAPVTLELQIAYAERKTDPVRALAGHCSEECEPSAVREQYRTRVRRLPAMPQSYPAAVGEEGVRRLEKDNSVVQNWANLPGVFPQEPDEKVRHRNEAQKQPLAPPPFPAEGDAEKLTWVTLGVVDLTATWEGETPKLKSLAFSNKRRLYRQLFSNDTISKLVFALADRVDESARVRSLTYPGLPGDAGEGQAGPVYRTLPKSLRVKVTDGHGGFPKDLASVKVRFEVLTADGGKLSATAFNDATPYADDQPAPTVPLDVLLDPATGELATPVHWRLSKTPGAHTVSARLVAADATDPPFQPGAQLVFRATAAPTAPTVIGVSVHDWHTPVRDGCVKWKGGSAKLRVVFSRPLAPEAFPHAGDWLKVWRISSGSCDPVRPDDVTPPAAQSLTFLRSGPVGNAADPRAAWFADFTLPLLLEGLHDHFTLRMLVALRPPANLLSLPVAVGEPLYPNPQQLDAEFAGSYVAAADRQTLWDTNALSGTVVEQWERFAPRERSLPSGDGAEGAAFPNEFHKAFEFQLPRGC